MILYRYILAFLLLSLPAAPALAGTCAAGEVEQLRAAVAANRLIQAQRMLGRLHADCSETRDLQELTADVDLRLDRAKSAYARFAALARQFPDDAALAGGAGRAALRSGLPEESFAYLTRAIALASTDWRVWNAFGILLDRRKDWAGSARAYEEGLRLAPDQAGIWSNRGYSMILQRRFEEALPFLDRAAALDSNDEDIRRTRDFGYALAGIYHDVRRPGETIRDYAERLNNMGYAAWLAGDKVAARSLLSRAVQASETRFEIAERNLARVEASE